METPLLFIVFVIVFIFGAIVGSFLNVVIFRYNTGRFKDSDSRCLSCARTLSWWQMVPILSYIYLRGRCAQCGSKISWQYSLVEFITASLFVLTFIFFGVSLLTLFWWVVSSLMVVIAFYDARHKIVPDGLVYTLIVLGFLKLVADFNTADFMGGLIAFTIFFLFWYLSGGTWMGLGDGKLALAIMWLLGWSAGVSAIIISFWLGALVGIMMLLVRSKQYKLKSELPFAPFMIAAFFLALFLNINLIWIAI